MNILTKKIIGTSVLFSILLAGTAFSATSAEAKKEIIEKIVAKTYNGTVIEFGKNEIKIETSSDKSVTINITEETEFTEDVLVGDDVTIATVQTDDNKIAAKTVRVKNRHRYGHGNGN
ncbi:MAG: hypothetical protein M0P97_00825 [Candidatus Moranbacteria bacterium]|jgi:hypothetical protein|nr:hypothetical protein [Candidatus Moranbacteria bacterium]